jgi:hypothetical protein
MSLLTKIKNIEGKYFQILRQNEGPIQRLITQQYDLLGFNLPQWSRSLYVRIKIMTLKIIKLKAKPMEIIISKNTFLWISSNRRHIYSTSVSNLIPTRASNNRHIHTCIKLTSYVNDYQINVTYTRVPNKRRIYTCIKCHTFKCIKHHSYLHVYEINVISTRVSNVTPTRVSNKCHTYTFIKCHTYTCIKCHTYTCIK